MTPATDLLSPSDLLKLIRHAQAERNNLDQLIDSYKAQLQQHFDSGDISDTFTTDNIQARYQQRTTYKYSQAVEDLKGLERMEGVATKCTSRFWTISEKKSSASSDS